MSAGEPAATGVDRAGPRDRAHCSSARRRTSFSKTLYTSRRDRSPLRSTSSARMLSIAAGFASLPEASMRLTRSSRFEAEIVRDAMISLSAGAARSSRLRWSCARSPLLEGGVRPDDVPGCGSGTMSHLQKAGRRHTRTHAEHARARARARCVSFGPPRPAERSSRSAPAFRQRGPQIITSIHI